MCWGAETRLQILLERDVFACMASAGASLGSIRRTRRTGGASSMDAVFETPSSRSHTAPPHFFLQGVLRVGVYSVGIDQLHLAI